MEDYHKQIERLKVLGLKVSIRHFRYTPAGHLKRYFRHSKENKFSPAEKGGLTICKIQDEDTILANGQANCSKKDNFCYKLGSQIAIGRAIKSMEGVA